MKYLVLETERFVVYYEQDGIVHRDIYFNKEDVYSKYSYEEVKELEPTDPLLVHFRTKLLNRQLDDNFLSNLSSPIDDDKVCRAIMETLFSNEIMGNSFRMSEDSKYYLVRLDPLTQEKDYYDLLKTILDNYDELSKHFVILNKESIKRLIYLKDNPEQLLALVKKATSLINSIEMDGGILLKLNKDDYDLYGLFVNLLDFRQEHVGEYKGGGSDYDERIYLNCHDENILHNFMNEYAKECIKYGIDYNCKGLFNTRDNAAADTTILYSQHKDLKQRIRIIESIMSKHPEWRNVFNAPVYAGLTVGTGFYSLCHKGTKSDTYSNYYSRTFLVVRCSLIAKILIEQNMISKSDPNYDNIIKLAKLDISYKKSNTGGLLSSLFVDDKNIFEFINNALKYLNNSEVQKKLMETSPDEFRKRVYKVHSIYQGFDESLNVPLAIDKGMIEYFGYKKSLDKDNLEKKTNTEEELRLKNAKHFNGVFKDSSPGPFKHEKKEVQETLNTSKKEIDIREIIINISKKLDRYILAGKSFDEKKLMANFKILFKDYIKDNYDHNVILKIAEELKLFEQNGVNTIKVKMLERLMSEKKQVSKEDKIKEQVEQLKNKLVDYNGDGYISIEETIRSLSNKCVKYMMSGGTLEQKKLFSAINTELKNSIANGKYDIELLVKLDEAINQYEQRKDVESIEILDGIRSNLERNRANDIGIAKTDRIFKTSAMNLFHIFNKEYRETVISLQENGIIDQIPMELEEIMKMMMNSYIKAQTVEDERFDMNKYKIFREILVLLNQETTKIIENIKRNKNDNIEEGKKIL